MERDLYHLVSSPAWEDKLEAAADRHPYETWEEHCCFDGAYLTFSALMKCKAKYVPVEAAYPVTACRIRDFDYLERPLQDWIARMVGERAVERGRPTGQGNLFWRGELFGFIRASGLLIGDCLEFRYKGNEQYFAWKEEPTTGLWHFRFIHPSELPQDSRKR